jgi:hypothetical protein
VIKIDKNIDLNTFLKQTIWGMATEDEIRSVLDPESWILKARSGSRKIVLNRHSFRDSIYYSNIQNILNICKIKDYKYPR